MAGGAQLSVTDLRQATRHPVEFRVIAEHRRLGDVPMMIINISAHGFMIGEAAGNAAALDRGERVTIRLPRVGQIEAHVIWISGVRAGFQFERIIRLDDFTTMIAALQPNERLRRTR